MIPELDGVRGIAILLVLFYHFKGQARPAVVPRFLYDPVLLGWSGVDLFFVLSGFLITGILIDTRDSRNYFSSFYARRVLRIFPLYLAAVFLYFYIAMPMAHRYRYWPYNDHSFELWYWIHLSNWKSAFGIDHALMTHFWSLAIEEQFYLVWPVLIFLMPPSWLGYVCAVLIGLCPILRYAWSGTPYPELLHRLTPFRIDTLAFGALAAVIVRNPKALTVAKKSLRWIFSTAIVTLGGVILVQRSADSSLTPMAVLGYSALAAIYGCFVLVAYASTGSATRIAAALRNPVLKAFGKYSYGIYVIHNPIAYYMNSVVARLGAPFTPTGKALVWLCSVPLGISASFLLALMSWSLLEKRFLRMKHRFEPTL